MAFRKIKRRIVRSLPFQKMLEWSMTHSLPGTAGVPIYDILRFFRKEMKNEDIMLRANSIAFSFFLSLFPAIIFLISLLPYLPIENFIDNMKLSILSIFPTDAANFIINTIESITEVERGGVLSVSFLMALLFSSNGMISMMRGFDKSYEISYRTRSGLQKRGVAILLTVLIASMLVVSVGLIIFGQNLIDLLFEGTRLDAFSVRIFHLLRWMIIVALIYSGVGLIYYRGPALKRRLKFMSAGASVATLLIVLSSIAFSFFVNQFGTYNKVYGSISALIVILLVFQINSLILLIGYELNASIAINRDIKAYREEHKSTAPAEAGDIESG